MVALPRFFQLQVCLILVLWPGLISKSKKTPDSGVKCCRRLTSRVLASAVPRPRSCSYPIRFRFLVASARSTGEVHSARALMRSPPVLYLLL